ncbi:hypothetical protein METBIDRAFT_115945 [Metschnikowia bicuspidata var. bicuspidata NRRL YB-4993]|uniref:RhoGEF-domain-containing protein n=1 Tax=Metschnikowia bicuspidata var. bicuspidata NRRL YB-4993 TaxID=869754 RepID=A0A1A0HJI2_9ASCO|nr:hypothetical protein METBIDRAFT_115945 [Metschnikowia bicuspidata var. bicuspidata NRRL YB-4993]OBA23998.1 hypothetical protein METBIDRAFT_115945 [Metschnikowia bicuspidata var. bicuspidata NRRL YB-4993]
MDQLPHPPFRSASLALTPTVSLSLTSISRVALGPIMLNMSMNKTSLAEDHMFYKSRVLIERLSTIQGMPPYIMLAHAAAERCAEQQALAFSQQLQQSDGSPTAFRSSVGSGGFSMYLDTLALSYPNTGALLSNNLFTFTAGVLPANLSLDPATQLWKLFQQGAPLCLIFNAIDPAHSIPVQAGDDLRMCKKAVYDFVVAVKTHLAVDDDAMFTISNVFSDNTHDLLKIIDFVSALLDQHKVPGPDAFPENVSQQLTELKVSDDRSKVFKELIQTERKYILDLELLLQYRNELQAADVLSSEQLHVLFPNLSDVIDFHRRFLCGFECNIDVPTKYQRIGSVFLHASNGPFRAYEPWTIGQVGAIDLINREASNLKKASTLIDPGFELQSYIIKPIQRLCKYPLLLKELIKAFSDPSDAAYYNELLLAQTAMKDVANQVNEAQRRSENVGLLQNLIERVKDWRGFNFREQGDLLYHSVVSIKDGESEKDYVAYLFERIIFFFIETNPADKQKDKKKRDLLTSRKKSGSNVSGSTANLLESLNGVRENTTLELKGRVYISEIYNISSANLNGYTLVISWSGKKESGSFVLRYRTEEPRNQWENCLRHLKTNEMNNQLQRKLRDSRGSLGTNYSFDTNSQSHFNGQYPQHAESPSSRGHDHEQRHISSSSTFSMMRMSKNSAGSSTGPSHGDSTAATSLSPLIAIKIVYQKSEISEPLQVTQNMSFRELHQKVASYVSSSPGVVDDVIINKLRYKDEEGDFVVMSSSDDWQLALDMVEELVEENGSERTLSIWVS